MKIKIARIISIVFSILFICCFAGCHSEKEINETEQRISENLKSFTFELNCYALTGECTISEPQKYYYPENLKLLTGRYVFDKSKIVILAEKIYPDGRGMIESSGFYIGADDNGNWLDELLIRIEEERIAEEIKLMEENIEDAEVNPDTIAEIIEAQDDEQTEPTDLNEQTETQTPETAASSSENKVKSSSKALEIETLLSNEKESVEILDKSKQLQLMNYDEEIFMPQKTESGWIIIQTLADKIERNFYDEDYRLTVKEVWKINGINNSDIMQIENYFYNEQNFKPYKKEIETDSKHQIIEYNENGAVVDFYTYSIYEENEYLVSKIHRKYDDEKRLLSNETIDYTYKDETFEKMNYTFSKRYEYKYNLDEEIPPDFEYFENNEIKMKNKYSTVKGNYTSQIFFEDGFSVKTFYEDELKIKDVYYQNDEVTRIKEYER